MRDTRGCYLDQRDRPYASTLELSGIPSTEQLARARYIRHQVGETYQRWAPVPDVVAPCAYIVLCTEPAAFTVRLRFSGFRDAPARDLLVRFGHEVAACSSHDEFLHPWQTDESTGEVPRLQGAWARYTYPLLQVEGSRWLASFSDGQLVDYQHVTLLHYRFVSLDNTVDVITAGAPTAEWVPTAP